MKIVINKCFGGFGLSPAATRRLAELNGKKCFFYINPREGGMPRLSQYVPVTEKEATEAFMWFAFDVDDPTIFVGTKDWHEMTLDEKQEHNRRYEEHSLGIGRELQRDDPKLIQVVEELGDAANGTHAELEIIEIPDGVSYEIDEYDGVETIHETHRSWG